MHELNHENHRVDVLKIECEGWEWTSYHDWTDPTIHIRQMLIETHPHLALKRNVSVGTMFATFVKKGFVPFNKEANTHPKATKVSMFEYSFVRLRRSFQNKSLE